MTTLGQLFKTTLFSALGAFIGCLLACRAVGAPPVPSLESSITPTLPDAWEQMHEAQVADGKARAGQIQIVLLGDSATVRWLKKGVGLEIYQQRYVPHGVINLGINNDTTQNVLWRLQHGALDALHPKMVLLLIGTYNWDEEPDAVAYGVWAIVAQIRRTHPETRVLVEGIFPRVDSQHPELEAKIPVINQLLAKLDDGKMVKFLDLNDRLLKPDGSFNYDTFPDISYPERLPAFQTWADAVQPTVDLWLKEPPIPNVPPPAPPVPKPNDLLSSTPAPRNEWLAHFNRTVTLAKQGQCDLLFLGDITMACWTRLIPLFQKEYGAWHALNFAIWDSRTENILWQLQNGGVDGLKPKLVVVQIQENLEDNTPAENVAAGMQVITQLLREKLPAAKILLEGAFPKGGNPNDPMRQKLAAYNALLAKLADNKSVFYLDIGAAFIRPDGTLKPIPRLNPCTQPDFENWADAQRATIAGLMK